MIQSKVYRLKKDCEISRGILLKENQEVEIVRDVVYINGNMVPPNYQELFYDFITKNEDLFENVTKNW